MNIPTPNIIIRNYSYGEKVTAGQVFDLEMEMTNTSSVDCGGERGGVP